VAYQNTHATSELFLKAVRGGMTNNPAKKIIRQCSLTCQNIYYKKQTIS